LFATEAIDDKCPLFLRKPLDVFGEIWDDEEESSTDNASENAFEDEDLLNLVNRQSCVWRLV
jgi:hypothetical protein